MKAEDVAAARITLILRHKRSGKAYRTILNSHGFSWMQVRNGKLVVNARRHRCGRPYGPIRLIDPENYAEDVPP
jgi:ribosomal protein L34